MADEEQGSSLRATIDPDGDLVLVIEDKGLLVSRKTLCLGSSVFHAMLRDGSPFWESTDQAVASDGFRHILLKEDNYEAMKIVASVIHLQHDMVAMEVSFEVLDALAKLCDKYDLRKCLGLWPQKWSEPYTDSVPKPCYERWLFIALAFRNDAVFCQISRHLILNTAISETGDLQFPGSSETSDGVPAGILCKDM